MYFDTKNDWLFNDWRGDLSLVDVQAGCLTIVQCFLERTYSCVLNNNTDLTGLSPSAPPWLARDYLPHLGLAGIEYLAWVCAPSLLLKHLTGEAVRQLRAPMVATFDHLADAYAWLQHTHVAHPGDTLPLRTPAQQTELAGLRQAEAFPGTFLFHIQPLRKPGVFGGCSSSAFGSKRASRDTRPLRVFTVPSGR